MCLSLLGTWTGRDSECWNPQTSTILQARIRHLDFFQIKFLAIMK